VVQAQDDISVGNTLNPPVIAAPRALAKEGIKAECFDSAPAFANERGNTQLFRGQFLWFVSWLPKK
jgi:hypothetical protein